MKHSDDEDLPGNHDAANEEASYQVGYGKPPKQTQFKPGNKQGKGRPKGSKNFATILNEVVSAKVPAKINGKTKKLTKIELSLQQLANKASAGDLKAIAKLIDLYQQYGPPEELAEISDEQAAYDMETIIHHLKMGGEIPLNHYNEDAEDE